VSGSAAALSGKMDEVTLYNSAITPPALLDNKVARYLADGDAKDSIWGWDAVPGAGTTYVARDSGQCWAFSGSNSLVVLPSGFIAAQPGQSWSLIADIYVNASGNSGYRDILGYAYNSSPNFGTLYLNAGKLEHWASGSKQIQGTTTLPTATWTEVKLTWNAADSRTRLYINGVLEGTSGAHNEYLNVPIAFGGSYSGITGVFQGRIDDVRLFNALV
jgi:hypothetical protein